MNSSRALCAADGYKRTLCIQRIWYQGNPSLCHLVGTLDARLRNNTVPTWRAGRGYPQRPGDFGSKIDRAPLVHRTFGGKYDRKGSDCVLHVPFEINIAADRVEYELLFALA